MPEADVTYRMNRAFIPGTILYIAIYGHSEETQGPYVSETSKPATPTVGTDPEYPWLFFGKVRQFQALSDSKTVPVEGVAKNGSLSSLELRLRTISRFRFTTNWTTPETLQLAFGTRSQIANNKPQPFFESNGEIDVWMYSQMVDLTAGNRRLLITESTGSLRLVQSPTWNSDAISNEFELMVRDNPLSHITPLDVQDGVWKTYGEANIPPTSEGSLAPAPNN